MLAVSSEGALRKAYSDTTPKRVSVWIWSASKEKTEPLFFGAYALTGGDLQWITRWRDSQDVVVEFYDFGEKYVSQPDVEKAAAPSSRIATLTFTYDSTSGRFVEKKE